MAVEASPEQPGDASDEDDPTIVGGAPGRPVVGREPPLPARAAAVARDDEPTLVGAVAGRAAVGREPAMPQLPGDDCTALEVGAPGARQALSPGRQFHHYQIEAEIGRGGMGVVYRARHLQLKKTVALKVLLAGALATDEERRRFLREAEAVGHLNHPNVVPVLDAGEHEGTYYLTMDYVPGRPLGTWAREVRDVRTLVTLFARVCQGVHHAHSRGVIHRDLKPDNVLVDEAGEPRVLDFGIAKRIDDDTKNGPLTTEGEVLGTLRYMPPEQALGLVQDVDIRSDVYSLGCILYEVLCGRPAVAGSLGEIIDQIRNVEPRPPSVTRPDLPWELDAICLKALEKERENRYQSALELEQDVQRFLGDLPILARRATAWNRAWKWTRRNRRKAVMAAVAAGVVLLSLGGWAGNVISTELEHRRGVREAVLAGWRHFAAGEHQAAVDELNAAERLIRLDEVLALPGEVAAVLPPELLAGLSPEERERPRATADRLRRWTEHARRYLHLDEVARVVDTARRTLDAGQPDEAAQELLVALRLVPDHPAARELSGRVCRALVLAGREEMARGADLPLEARRERLRRACDRFDAAQRLDPYQASAREALAEAHVALGRLAELEQEELLQQRARDQAARLCEEGQGLLEREDLDGARRAFEQALGFVGTNAAAQEGLRQVERRLAARRQDEATRRGLEQAAALVREGEAALQRGAVEEARTRFVQALAFDGASAGARDGLLQVYRLSEARAELERERDRRRRADALVLTARQGFERGRVQFRQGELPEQVRESYFAALEALQQALFVDRAHQEALRLLPEVGGEFALVLVDQGYPELSEFVRRISGAQETRRSMDELPWDPHLAVIEADRVNIRRAYGGVVRFMPTRGFDRLREYVRARGGDRWRVVIEVRSEVVRPTVNQPPQLVLKGLSVRLEDRVAQTIRPPVHVDFDGRFIRAVVVDGERQRLVRPFDQTPNLDPAPYIERVSAIVRAAVEPPKD